MARLSYGVRVSLAHNSTRRDVTGHVSWLIVGLTDLRKAGQGRGGGPRQIGRTAKWLGSSEAVVLGQTGSAGCSFVRLRVWGRMGWGRGEGGGGGDGRGQGGKDEERGKGERRRGGGGEEELGWRKGGGGGCKEEDEGEKAFLRAKGVVLCLFFEGRE